MVEDYNVKDISVAQRQIHILSLLSSNPQGFSINELVDKLRKWDIEVSKRTISRDIDELSASYSVFEEERNGKTYFYADRYNLKNVDLTISDMISLSFIKELLAPYNNTGIGEDGLNIIDKILSDTAHINKMHLQEMKNIIQIVDVKNNKNIDVNVETEQIIKTAIDKQHKLNITYRSFSNDEETSRIIRPFSIVFNDGYMCVEGFCELREEIRSFRISRIMRADILDNKFEIPNEYFATRRDNQFIHLSGTNKENIKIEFYGKSARFVKEYDGQIADNIVDIDNGIIFEKETAITDELIKWILGYGSGAKVIEPPRLVELINDEIKHMVDMY